MTKDNDSPGDRIRVYGKIAPLIIAFSKENAGRQFHVDQLRRYVERAVPDIAPDSPGRILRELRLDGRLDYFIVDRRQSLYQFRTIKRVWFK